MNELDELTLNQLMDLYFDLFGATFSKYAAFDLDEKLLTEKLKEAITSNAPFTDADLGLEVAKDTFI